MNIYTKESLVLELQKIRNTGWIENRRHGNNGGIGNTLEDLLGIPENNLPIPNAAEWELKTQRANSTSLTTLLHMEPSPTACRFVPQILLPLYGWEHKEAGKRYPNTELSFRQTINAKNYSDRGFAVVVDRENKKISISFDYTKITVRHDSWKESVKSKVGFAELSPQPYWGFCDLFYKVAAKLHNCFYVKAAREMRDGKEYFHYSEILMLREISQEKFIDAIEDGAICVDFDARTGHNHGTKFRIRQNKIPELYSECTRL